MAARKVTRKKSASEAPRPAKQTRVVPDALISGELNDDAIASKDAASLTKKPKIHAKTVHLILSIGTEDRKRTIEKFTDDLLKSLGVDSGPHTKWKCASCGTSVGLSESKCKKCGNKSFDVTRIPGLRAAVTSSHYILDGKVCLPEDYDPKTGTFKKGSTPPSWAGGPKHNPSLGVGNQIQYDLEHLSRDEYDKKYRLGKYRVTDVAAGKVITAEEQKRRHEQWQLEKQRKEEAGLEEFDWDESDIEDTEKLSKEADKSAKRAIKRLQNSKKSASPKKRTVKKSTTPKPAKKTVRRKK